MVELKPKTEFYEAFRNLFEEYNEDYFCLPEHREKQQEYRLKVHKMLQEYDNVIQHDMDLAELFLEYGRCFWHNATDEELESQCEYADKLRELFCLRTGHLFDDDMCGIKTHAYCLNCAATAWRMGYWEVGKEFEKVLEEGQIVAIATEYEEARDLLGDCPPCPHPSTQEQRDASYAHTLAVRKLEKELIHNKIEAIVNERS